MSFKLKDVFFSFGPCILSQNIAVHEKLETVLSYFLCIHTFLCAWVLLTDQIRKCMHLAARKKYL